jgi:hypothetical protein
MVRRRNLLGGLIHEYYGAAAGLGPACRTGGPIRIRVLDPHTRPSEPALTRQPTRMSVHAKLQLCSCVGATELDIGRATVKQRRGASNLRRSESE